MLNDWLLYNNSFCAIELVNTKDDLEVYHCLILVKRKKELVVKSNKTFDDLSKVISFLKSEKQKHLVLVVNNKQVLSKSITHNKNSIQNVFSNLNPSEFYFQKSDRLKLASAVRKTYVDDLIQNFENEKISILDFSLNNYSIEVLLGLLEYDEIYTSNGKIEKTDDELKFSKDFKEESYKVNGLSVKSTGLLSLGAITDYYVRKERLQTDVDTNEFKHKVFFDKGFRGVLVFSFIILLINFLFFNHYFNKVSELNDHLEIYNSTKTELIELKKQVSEKEKLAYQIEKYSSTNLSKNMDDIVQDLPRTILLSNLNYQPFESSVKKGKEIKLKSHQIQIEGSFRNNEDLSIWIDSLEKLEWVKDVTNISVKNNKVPEFNFLIIIGDEL